MPETKFARTLTEKVAEIRARLADLRAQHGDEWVTHNARQMQKELDSLVAMLNAEG